MTKRSINDTYFVAGPLDNLRAGTGKHAVPKLYMHAGGARASMNYDKTIAEEDKIVTEVLLVPIVGIERFILDIIEKTIKICVVDIDDEKPEEDQSGHA